MVKPRKKTAAHVDLVTFLIWVYVLQSRSMWVVVVIANV